MSDGTIFLENRPRPTIALPLRTELHGRFAVGRLLGRPGGFGITYLALDLRLQRTVALKEYFPRNLAAREGGTTVVAQTHDDGEQLRFGRERFLYEARTLARFDHQGIVRVQDFFEANGTAYLVMPYYEGETLEAYLRSQPGGRLDERTAVALMLRVMDALRIVHEAGLLHRDIKPENIYLRHPTGQPTLLDFGSAQAETAQRSMTVERALTPGYAAVEQYITDGVQGPWTDLYACGATLYRLLTGQVPPEALSRIGAVDPLRPLSAVVPEVDASVAACVAWALQAQATARPQDARALQQRLQEAVKGETFAAADAPALTLPVAHAAVPHGDLPGPLSAAPPRVRDPDGGDAGARRSKRRKAVLAATIAILALAAAGTSAVLAPRIAVQGTVRDDAGRTLSGVVVELSGAGDVRTATTDANGQFRFRWLVPDRQYAVRAGRSGYHITTGDRAAFEARLREDTDLSFRARTAADAFAYYAVRGDSLVQAGLDANREAGVAEGLGALDVGLAFFPDSAHIRYSRMRARWYTGDYAGCLEDIGRLPAGRAGDIEGWCHVGARNYDAAAATFRERAGRSTSADPHIGLAVLNYRQGETANALAHFRDAVGRFAAFAGGRSRVQQAGGYYYNPAEWATIEAIHGDYARRAGVPYTIRNDCRYPVRFAMRYLDTTGTWKTAGWWTFDANTGRTLEFTDGSRPASSHTVWYFYAETIGEPNLRWRTETNAFTLEGRTLNMHTVEGGNEHTLTCP